MLKLITSIDCIIKFNSIINYIFSFNITNILILNIRLYMWKSLCEMSPHRPMCSNTPSLQLQVGLEVEPNWWSGSLGGSRFLSPAQLPIPSLLLHYGHDAVWPVASLFATMLSLPWWTVSPQVWAEINLYSLKLPLVRCLISATIRSN